MSDLTHLLTHPGKCSKQSASRHQCSHFAKHASRGVFCYDVHMQKYKTVDEFLNNLDTDKRQQVDALRHLIMKSEPKLEEHIKWNAPSYVLDGDDRITFNLMNKQGVVKLILHMGATRKETKKGTPLMQDESGLIEWSSDIRGIITFTSIQQINSSLPSLEKSVKNWLSIPSTT